MAVSNEKSREPQHTEAKQYAIQAVEIFYSITKRLETDARGYRKEGVGSDGISVSDNLMFALFCKALGRNDVADNILKVSKERYAGAIAYSEHARILFSALGGLEVKPRRLDSRAEDEKPDKALVLLDAVKSYALTGALPEVKLSQNPNSAVSLALNGIVVVLQGRTEEAKALAAKIDENFLDRSTGLYRGSINRSELFPSSCVGLFLCTLAGADLYRKRDCTQIFEGVD